MSNIINTKSYLFKLYSDRLVRKDIRVWNVNEVLALKTNICHYVRNIFLQMCYRSIVNFGKFLGILFLTSMVLVPIVSGVAWLVTDNPFIVWLGGFGAFVLLIDAALGFLLFCFAVSELWTHIIKPRFFSATESVAEMSPIAVMSQWIKDKHGKFCTSLQFDREHKPDSDVDLNDQEWPHE